MEVKQSFEDVLNRDGRLAYTNVGVSMRPLIREGRDVMVIDRCDASALRRYDAVLFRREHVKGRGEYVLHRILKTRPDGNYFIAGDNCTGGETVKPSQILGVLSGLSRGGKPVDFNGFRYKAYVRLWCAPYPVRFLILRVKQFVVRYLSAILRRAGIRR